MPEKRTATGVPRKLGARRRRQSKALCPDGGQTGLVLGWDASVRPTVPCLDKCHVVVIRGKGSPGKPSSLTLVTPL